MFCLRCYPDRIYYSQQGCKSIVFYVPICTHHLRLGYHRLLEKIKYFNAQISEMAHFKWCNLIEKKKEKVITLRFSANVRPQVGKRREERGVLLLQAGGRKVPPSLPHLLSVSFFGHFARVA